MVFMVEVFSVSIGNYFKVIAKNVFGIQTGKKPYKDSGIENFGKVDENLYRGSEPKLSDYAKLKKVFDIKTVVDLTDDEEPEEYAERRAEVEKQGMIYVHLPLSDKKYPTEAQLAKISGTVMDNSLYPIYSHCRGGRHRSSLFSTVYRVLKYNWSAEQCYKESKEYDFYSEFGHGSIKRAIFDFAEKNRK